MQKQTSHIKKLIKELESVDEWSAFNTINKLFSGPVVEKAKIIFIRTSEEFQMKLWLLRFRLKLPTECARFMHLLYKLRRRSLIEQA
jgi:hypothetical protein